MYGLECQALTNTTEMDYSIIEMRKIIKWTLVSKDKMVIFGWITEKIASNSVHNTWVEGCIRDSQLITKGTLNCKGKAW